MVKRITQICRIHARENATREYEETEAETSIPRLVNFTMFSKISMIPFCFTNGFFSLFNVNHCLFRP